MAGALAATEPWWEPGTRHAYHTNTYGHLIGEVVRRVSGETCRRPARRRGRPPDADVHVGVPPGEQHRCADVLFAAPGPPAALDDSLEGDAPMEMLSYFNPPGFSSMGVVNPRSGAAPRSRRPTGTARRAAWRACTPRCSSRALAVGRPAGRGDLGPVQRVLPHPARGRDVRPRLQADGPAAPFGPNPGSFGHFGTGGAVGFADPVGGVLFGYVMNHVVPRGRARAPVAHGRAVRVTLRSGWTPQR